MEKMTIEQATKIKEYFDTVDPCCEECAFYDNHCTCPLCEESVEDIMEDYNSEVESLYKQQENLYKQQERYKATFEKIKTLKTSLITDKEKRYLETILEPYIDNYNITIRKEGVDSEYIVIRGDEKREKEENSVVIRVVDFFDLTFPSFKKGTRYKGMEKYKFYTPEELGLFADDESEEEED